MTQTAESALQVRPASVEGGTFTVRGSLETACQPDAIYQTLVDYANLPTVFKNLDSCRSWTEDGQKKLLQVCRWEFLIFSGTFETTLSVSEHPDQGRLVFNLLQSAFMRNFHVCWQLKPLPNGRTLVQHELTVDPIVDPPPAFRGYAEKIFYQQVQSLLQDLQHHLKE
ncbi:hypothetical protein WJX74_001276 [Apatococcus lobatus]|uniref:Coenzyme Q-binding protein COQ10 START domain-containing protein n=1 Tax=Apatococcus lobatus TaxID=904363 RepID=A0AAW1QCI5_9CHLO